MVRAMVGREFNFRGNGRSGADLLSVQIAPSRALGRSSTVFSLVSVMVLVMAC